MPTHIGIPTERAEQLDLLAKSLGISVADAVGVLINDAIAAGKIPDVVPGITIERTGDLVTMAAQGAFVKSMTRETARQIAFQARNILDGTVAAFSNGPDGIGILRRGSGVKFRDLDSGGEKTVAKGIARDVARLLDRAASE